LTQAATQLLFVRRQEGYGFLPRGGKLAVT
jgi:hypothetical protein